MRIVPIVLVHGLALGFVLPPPVTGQAIGPGVVMSGLDADGDGRISKAEYIAYRDQEFARFDRNGDGVLGPVDFPRASSYQRALGTLDERISAADRNGDGQLSREELHNAPTIAFDKADTSKNGYLSPSEIDNMRSTIFGIR